MRIGVDLDNVLNDLYKAILPYLNRHYGTSVKFDDLCMSDFQYVWGRSKEEILERFDKFYRTPQFHGLQPRRGAVRGVAKLKEKGHELVVISSRPASLEEVTRQWIGTHFPDMFFAIYLTNFNSLDREPRRTKASVCLDEKTPLHIEDSFGEASECAKEGVRVLLVDRPWNRYTKWKRSPDGIVRVLTWRDISEEVGNYARTLGLQHR